MTWRALAPGGVVFGDDWLFPVGAHRDIIHFATEMKDELDDGWGLKVRHIRVLGCVRPGLFVSDRSFQWFMKKLPHVPTAPGEDPRTSAGTLLQAMTLQRHITMVATGWLLVKGCGFVK